MSEKIAVIEEEYSAVKGKLQDAHNQIIEDMTALLAKLEGISSSGGEFYTDEISPKVSLLCEELIAAQRTMSEVYTAHEEIVSSFVSAIGNLDTCS